MGYEVNKYNHKQFYVHMIFLNIVLNIVMAFKDKYGSWAVIAGSAEGLGEAWSRALAQKGMNLIMVDHQEEKLLTGSSPVCFPEKWHPVLQTTQ